jgi:hypothetical protein
LNLRCSRLPLFAPPREDFLLGGKGYGTSLIGKWHLGEQNKGPEIKTGVALL